jgi:hypothetical protein
MVLAGGLLISEELLYPFNEAVQLVVMYPMSCVGESYDLHWALECFGAAVGYWI